MPTDRLGPRLYELAYRLTRIEAAALNALPHDLTFRQYRLLSRVDSGLTTLTDLQRVVTLTLPTLSGSVDGIVRRGLLTRAPDAHDRRVVQLRLTPLGSEALADAERALACLSERLLGSFTEEQIHALSDLLEVLNAEAMTVQLESGGTSDKPRTAR